jgi:hypothetical protein
MTIEKGVLVGLPGEQGLATDAEIRAFAAALGRKRARFAFPNAFVDLMRPLSGLLGKRYGKDSPEGHHVSALQEIRVSARPSWTAETVAVCFWFVKGEEPVKPEWDKWIGAWLALVKPTATYTTIEGRAHESLHEVDLVEADVEEEPGELDERFLGKVAAAVKIVAALRVAGREVSLVRLRAVRESAGDRPEPARVERVAQHGVGHETRDAAVAVEKRMYPEEAMVGGGGVENGLEASEWRVAVLPAARRRATAPGLTGTRRPTSTCFVRGWPGMTGSRSPVSGLSTHFRLSGRAS